MKNILLSLLSILLISCDNTLPESQNDTGTNITLRNNTFGVSDFDIASYKSYTICFGSFDYGRNFGRDNMNNYQDSIGFITFNPDGTGIIDFYNQDTIHIVGTFTFEFFKQNKKQYVDIKFEDVPVKTYVKSEPLYTFNYTKVNNNLWVFKSNLNNYNGNYLWFGNTLFSW